MAPNQRRKSGVQEQIEEFFIMLIPEGILFGYLTPLS
jgi:hypothetical protein